VKSVASQKCCSNTFEPRHSLLKSTNEWMMFFSFNFSFTNVCVCINVSKAHYGSNDSLPSAHGPNKSLRKWKCIKNRNQFASAISDGFWYFYGGLRASKAHTSIHRKIRLIRANECFECVPVFSDYGAVKL
jgi:hypothetical protein